MIQQNEEMMALQPRKQEIREYNVTDDRNAVALELVGLTKCFGEITAVDNLSLRVKYGEIFGLLGPNGSGKTTTINMISGLSKPSSGAVKVLGYNIVQHTRAIYAVLGTVPQETALYEELSAWTNMSVHADLYGVPRSDRDKRISDMLKLVELYDRRHSRVSTFSGGMKRRLTLARALLHDPQLLYLDEPTLGVDVQSRRAIWDYILDLKKKERKTVLLTTNYLEEANVLCDRIAIIDHGKLVALDTPVDLKRRYGNTILEIETILPPSEYLLEKLRIMKGISNVIHDDKVLKVVMTGDDASTTTGQLITLVTQEANLKTISQREPNLEEIFLSLTGSGLRD
jgi:daunorubicin resistance ABC transporter ATP-binding subunit